MTPTKRCRELAPTRGRTYAESWFLRFSTAANDTQREVHWGNLKRCFRSVSVDIEVQHGSAGSTDTSAPYYMFPDGTGLVCESTYRFDPRARRSTSALPSWFASVDVEGTLVQAVGFCRDADDPLHDWIAQPILYAPRSPRLFEQIPRTVGFEAYSTASAVVVAGAEESKTLGVLLVGIPLAYDFLEQWFVLREKHSLSTFAPIMSSLPLLMLRGDSHIGELFSDDMDEVEILEVVEVPAECVRSGVWMRRPIQVHESGWQVPSEWDETFYQTPPIPSDLLERALLAASPVDHLPELFPRMLKIAPAVALEAMESGLQRAGSSDHVPGDFLAGLVSRLDLVPLLESPEFDVRLRAQLILPRARN
jgi:hypothetical protein